MCLSMHIGNFILRPTVPWNFKALCDCMSLEISKPFGACDCMSLEISKPFVTAWALKFQSPLWLNEPWNFKALWCDCMHEPWNFKNRLWDWSLKFLRLLVQLVQFIGHFEDLWCIATSVQVIYWQFDPFGWCYSIRLGPRVSNRNDWVDPLDSLTVI